MFKNLLEISELSKEIIEKISNDAINFKNGKNNTTLQNKTVCLMFFENSTRTKISFEMAAKNLSMKVINFDTTTSSLNKGESIKETLENLYFIGVDAVIIRTSENNLLKTVSESLTYPISIINAGSGKKSHPTQALLDYVTMKEKFGNISGKKITIVGDIEHSRVAKSNIELLNKFNANITICSPEYFKPQIKPENVTYISDLKTAITGADVVMGLRIQRERILEAYSESQYIKYYSINSELLNKYAPNAILMHPGPVNRDVEITSELLDSPKAKTILEQAKNGVFTRMAILNYLLGETK